MPIRNPFARRTGGAITHDNAGGGDSTSSPDVAADIVHPGFERVDTVGSKSSSALSIRSRRSQDTGEYKMSVVNDSGIYLPPSPTEREATWPKRYLTLSRASSDTKSSTGQGEIEHFPISRESFDSYRRSFDICAKTPVNTEVLGIVPRQSLDSASAGRFSPHRHAPHLRPRSSLQQERRSREPPTPEEPVFEDVGLNDDSSKQQQQAQAPPKRRGFFSKFNGTDPTAATTATAAPASQHDVTSGGGGGGGIGVSRFLPLGGRKRGHSGQGAELGAMPISPPASFSSDVDAAETVTSRPGTAVMTSALQEQEVQS